MSKRIIALALAALLLLAEIPAALAKTTKKPTKKPTKAPKTLEEIMGIDKEYPKTMYVYTDNGGTLNVRSEPFGNRNNVIGQLEYGDKVTVISPVIVNTDWSVIKYKKGKDGVGYVMTRYLVNKRPKDVEKRAKERQEKKDKEELNRQLKSYKQVKNAIYIAVRAPRVSSWVNFRVGPGVAADRIASLPDGRKLKVIGETTSWYQAEDLETGKTGYVSKNFVTVIAAPKPTATPKKKK